MAITTEKKGYLQDNCIAVKLPNTKAGETKYSTLDIAMNKKILVPANTRVAFNLGADADNAAVTVNKKAYVDGSTFEAVSGGLPVANGTGLTELVSGGVTINQVRLFDNNNDEVLIHSTGDANVEDKRVYGFLRHTAGDGEDVADVTIDFGIWSDTNEQFEAYTLPAGDYKVELLAVYTLATAAEMGVMERIGSGKSIGEYATPTVKVPVTKYAKVAITSDVTLTDTDYTVKFVRTGASAGELQDSAGNKIQDLDIVSFGDSAKPLATNGALIDSAGEAELNGVAVQYENANVTDADTVEVKLKDAIWNGILYAGTILQFNLTAMED